MTVRKLLEEGQKILAPSSDAEWDAKEFLSALLSLPDHRFGPLMAETVSEEIEKEYRKMLFRRVKGIPTQYILRQAWFMGLPFYVDERVLIPRQDTELLCEEALNAAKERGYRTALDLCTGSGALAVSLSRLGGLYVSATDLSVDALAVAELNAQKNGVQPVFLQGDLLDAVPDGTQYDLIVCNPPYLSDVDMMQLQKEVCLEPEMALRGGGDGLDFYRRLANGAAQYLRSGGMLLMEIGATQGKAVMQLFAAWETELRKDLNGLDRLVIARIP